MALSLSPGLFSQAQSQSYSPSHCRIMADDPLIRISFVGFALHMTLQGFFLAIASLSMYFMFRRRVALHRCIFSGAVILVVGVTAVCRAPWPADGDTLLMLSSALVLVLRSDVYAAVLGPHAKPSHISAQYIRTPLLREDGHLVHGPRHHRPTDCKS